MRVNDIPTGAEIIASHQEATTDFVYKRERERVCVCYLSIHPPSNHRWPSAGCQGDPLTMAAVIDAMAMRAQSCIYDSGYPDAPAAALIKSDVIGAGGLAFFSHPILNFHMSCACFIVPSFFFTLSRAFLSLLL